MFLGNTFESVVFAKEIRLNTERLMMNLKFRNISWKEIQWLWSIVKKEFYTDVKENFFLSFLLGDKYISIKKMDKYELPECEEMSIGYDGILKDLRFGKIRSYSGAIKYIDNIPKWDEDYDLIKEVNKYRIAPREEFKSDLEYLEAYKKMISKEDAVVKSEINLPDINFIFNYRQEEMMYSGYVCWGINGYILQYDYTEILADLCRIFKKIAGYIQEAIGNIYLAPHRIELEGPPFGMELSNGIRDRYGELPYDLFLLGGCEWLNYVPNCLSAKHVIRDKGDDRINVQKDVNGYYFVINKPIKDVTIDDKRYIRKEYINPFLMKAEEYISGGAFRLFGERLPIFEEELQIENRIRYDGVTECWVKYVPMDF